MKKHTVNQWAATAAFVLLAVTTACSDTAKPATFCRFVPERKDDFAWENDLIAFRAYGPALREGKESSGIDCWLKRVNYPIIDKWYAQAEQDKSYHKDWGEGYDPYHVGSSAGCGGAALWLDGKRTALNSFTKYNIVKCTPEKSVFTLSYEDKIDGVVYGEERTITIELGRQLFAVHSVFTMDGKPASDLPICIGITTHDGKAEAFSDQAKGWVACWEEIDGSKLGTAAKIDPARLAEIKEVKSEVKDQGHIFIIAKTDAKGAIDYKAGYGWEKAGKITSKSAWQTYLNNL